MRTLFLTAGMVALCVWMAAPTGAQSLRGSAADMARQYRVAHDHDFTFLRTTRQVEHYAERGFLVHVPGNANYTLANVSHPYARPEVKLFVERLSIQYRAACGEPLVVTSLTRPLNAQPNNASRRSVHPTGMAIDLRISHQPACRIWLERTLLSLEDQGVLVAIRERRPPHYHVSVFPRQYARYAASLPTRSQPEPADMRHYRVRRGDSLWSIARSHGLDVDTLREANELADSRIYAGQTLRIPSAGN